MLQNYECISLNLRSQCDRDGNRLIELAAERMYNSSKPALFSLIQEKELEDHRDQFLHPDEKRTEDVHSMRGWYVLPGQYYLYVIIKDVKLKAKLLHLHIGEGAELLDMQPVLVPPDWLKSELGMDRMDSLYPIPHH